MDKKAPTNTSFQVRADFRLNACVGLNGGPYDFAEYAEGYRKAFDRLVESIKSDPNYVDLLFYPTAYLYRHAVELYLKSILTSWHKIENKDYKPQGHSLNKLIETFFDMSNQVPEMGGLDWIKIKTHITDIHELDGAGETFRYPRTNKTSDPTIPGSGLYNIGVLSEAAAYCLDELDNIAWWSEELCRRHFEAFNM